jgi:hypothetical protein
VNENSTLSAYQSARLLFHAIVCAHIYVIHICCNDVGEENERESDNRHKTHTAERE